MKLTNRYELPQAVVNAIANDPYDKQGADFSVTELIAPARARVLKMKHADELTEDVSDRLWSLYGQIAHGIMERGNAADLAEKRFFAKVGTKTLSGQIDTLSIEGEVLSDFKFTTVFGFMANKEPKEEWVQQLNMQLWLLRQNGLDAKKLQIIGLLRDWRPGEAAKNKNYPSAQMAKMEIPMWSDEATLEFITERVLVHTDALENLPLCTPSETWGGKRCSSYCSVNTWCQQYKNKGV